MDEMTVGIDIGTTSVKAVAADAGGTVLARARIPHRVVSTDPGQFEHDPQAAWIDGVLSAWEQVEAGIAGRPVAAVTVSAMVPSMCGVDSAGTPVTVGLLYGDARGRGVGSKAEATGGEADGFARWLAGCDGVEALWPAQAAANRALCGVAAIDSSTAMAMTPISDGQGWAPELLDEIGMTSEQFPAISPGAAAIGERDGALVSAGTIDVLGEQLVAPCGDVGDVLVMCGTTLLPWVMTDEWIEVQGLWTFPSARAGIMAVGGASNAGGLFVDRVRALVGDPASEDLLALGGDDLPVWLPYPRGERTPLHDPDRRAELLDVHVGHTSAHVLMAAYEAAGFVVRHHIELSGLDASRIVAVGGGTQSPAWMQALADTTGLAVDVSAEPYSAALGAAYHSRVTAGLEADTSQARRWGRVSHRVEPRAGHTAGAEGRYRRFREGTDR
ncbi:MAG: xylulose kinase [Acidimicrobiaceae bacterium]|nr:FGGY-family carbohydrate kinase [Acidimicrobiaceae bacterium]MXZ97404.1 xylulose kinase [Acidimicrobiaceae bacterium]MYF44607.1 xylulose kinase [Acidimicrobiaceae bacterium]